MNRSIVYMARFRFNGCSCGWGHRRRWCFSNNRTSKGRYFFWFL